MANLIWLREDVVAARARLDVWATERWRGGGAFLPSSDVRVLADAIAGVDRLCDRADVLYDAESDRYDRSHDRWRADCPESIASLDVDAVLRDLAGRLAGPWPIHLVPMLMHGYPRCGPYERPTQCESYRHDDLIRSALADGVRPKHARQHVRRVARSLHRRAVLLVASRIVSR